MKRRVLFLNSVSLRTRIERDDVDEGVDTLVVVVVVVAVTSAEHVEAMLNVVVVVVDVDISDVDTTQETHIDEEDDK